MGQLMLKTIRTYWQWLQALRLLSDDLRYNRRLICPNLLSGELAFEIVVGPGRNCQVANFKLRGFYRHGSKPNPTRTWPGNTGPAAYRKLFDARIKLIETNKRIGLIERARVQK